MSDIQVPRAALVSVIEIAFRNGSRTGHEAAALTYVCGLLGEEGAKDLAALTWESIRCEECGMDQNKWSTDGPCAYCAAKQVSA